MFKLFKRSTPTANEQLLQTLVSSSTASTSGVMVNAENAQTLPALYCAVATIAEAVASLPIHVYRTVNGERQRATLHHAERLLNTAPNDYQTAYDFKLALVRAVLLRGNGYARIYFDKSGTPQRLQILHPDSVIPELLDNGRLGYLITDKKGKQHRLLQEEIIHIRYHSDDGIIGKSPVQVCRDTIGLGLAQNEHGSKQLKNGITPTGVLKMDRMLTPEQRKTLTDSLQSRYGGQNNGKTIILENGMEWSSIGLSNTDAEWLESRLFTVGDVSRMFKLSPLFLQDYSNSTYSNFSEASRAFLSQTLRPWLTNLQQAFSSRLISERNQYTYTLEFETKDLLRATTEERFGVYSSAIRDGIMSPNECRRAENMPMREGGDEFSQSWLAQSQGINDGN